VAQRAVVWENTLHLAPSFGPGVPVQALGCQTTHSNQEVLQRCSLVIFATKPQVLPAVLAEVAPVVTAEHILVSVAAGVSLSTLEEVSDPWGCGKALTPELGDGATVPEKWRRRPAAG
jgi:glycerol-3-phosphate dehydrogenase